MTIDFASRTVLAWLLVLALGLALIVWGRWNPAWAYLLSINVVTFAAYGADKLAARRAWRRWPERTLHGLALLGGSPGGLLGQRTFRHKTVKRSFQVAFWLICAAQIVALAAYLYGRRW